tara:strand:- start:1673 stop:2434 length:762 start_codon:yes stop_codon:yes gene_type:complete
MKKINISKAINSINSKGYFILENFLTTKELNNVKKAMLETLHYIHPKKINNLQKKYYQVKSYNKKLKSNFYDIIRYDIEILKTLHNKEILNLVRKFFKVKTVFSANPQVTIHDDQNERLLMPHQEIANFSKDFLLMSIPIFDTNLTTGGLRVYENSHKYGYYNHISSNKIKSAFISPKITKKFDIKDLSLKAGSAVIWHSALIHGSYPTKQKKTVRINIVERYNPLKYLPYLKKANQSLKLPYYNFDYNKIKE